MPWKQHTPGCASCSCGCARLHDDFSTDTISSYTQFSGTWSIADGALSTSSANGVIKSNTTGAQYQTISTRFRSTERETVDLIGGMASYMQYVAARVEFDTEGKCAWLSLQNKTATGTAQLGERLRLENVDPSEWHTLNLCISPTDDLGEADIAATLIRANGEPACIMERLEQTTSNGVGLGTGGLGEVVEFDFLDWSDSAYDDNGCPECGCACLTSGDNFDRPSSTVAPEGISDVGCLWQICTNFWQVQNGYLIGRAYSHASIRHLVPFDGRADDWFASVDVKAQPGPKAIIHMGYDCSAGPAVVLEFHTGYKRSRLYLSDDGGLTADGYVEIIDTPTGEWCSLAAGLGQDGDLAGMAVAGTVARTSKGSYDVGDPYAGLGVRYHSDGGGLHVPTNVPVFFDNYSQGKGGAPCGLCWDVEVGNSCDLCKDSVTPDTILVELPELGAELGCGDTCELLKGAYLLACCQGGPKLSVVDGCCGWGAQIKSRGGNGPCRDIAYARAYVCQPGDNYRLVVWVEYFGNSGNAGVHDNHYWKQDLGPAAPDCKNLSAELEFWYSTSINDSGWYGCDAAGTTVNIRAV